MKLEKWKYTKNTDIDECTSPEPPCAAGPNYKCLNIIGSVNCTCADGYENYPTCSGLFFIFIIFFPNNCFRFNLYKKNKKEQHNNSRPVHEFPLPVKPSLQIHSKWPILSTQVELLVQLWFSHSFIYIIWN